MKKIVTSLIIIFYFSSSFSQPTLDVFPNPFYDQTTLTITLQQNDTVSLIIYNSMGVLVDSLIKEQEMPQGTNTIIYDTDTLVEGVYFAVLKINTNTILKKLWKTNQPVGINNNNQIETNWILYPNPSGNDGFNVSYELTRNAYVNLRLLDYTGKEVLRINKGHNSVGVHTEHINTSNLSKGLYFFVTTINEKTQAFKVVKL